MTETETRDEQAILQEAEQRRKEKAATMPPLPIPELLTERFNAAFNRVMQLEEQRKNAAQEMVQRDEGGVRRIELWNKANVPRRHAARGEFDCDEWIAKRDLIINEKLGTGFIIALIGTRGVGKTQIGVEVIRHQTTTRVKSATFVTAMEIFLDIKASYRKDATTDERAVAHELTRPSLLVIDEIQERAETAWEDRILTHLINRRYNDQKDTLLIGNIKPEEFSASVGTSIYSRLVETGGIIACEWESFRK